MWENDEKNVLVTRGVDMSNNKEGKGMKERANQLILVVGGVAGLITIWQSIPSFYRNIVPKFVLPASTSILFLISIYLLVKFVKPYLKNNEFSVPKVFSVALLSILTLVYSTFSFSNYFRSDPVVTKTDLTLEKKYNFEQSEETDWNIATNSSTNEKKIVSGANARSGRKSMEIRVSTDREFTGKKGDKNYGGIQFKEDTYEKLEAISAWVYIPENEISISTFLGHILLDAEIWRDGEKIPLWLASKEVSIKPGKWTNIFLTTTFEVWPPSKEDREKYETEKGRSHPVELEQALVWGGHINYIYINVYTSEKEYKGPIYFDDICLYT